MTADNDEDTTADSGVKRVGAPATGEPAEGGATTARSRAAAKAAPTKQQRLVPVLGAVAVLGLAGTGVFAGLWATTSSAPNQDPAAQSAARTFLTDFFNFNASTVDADFTAVTNMAVGQFATQAKGFFNSAIRQELEKAQAESRGQVRVLYIQSQSATTATYYAVVDQTYVNNKSTGGPQSDVVRLVVDLSKSGSTWKVSDVTVLEGATPASAGTASGSAGSSVPGQ